MLVAAYGPLLDIERDSRVSAPSFSERLARLRAGTPYVLTVLEPYDDIPLDRADLDTAVARLTANHAHLPPGAHYNVIAGRVGEAPTLTRSGDLPFRVEGRAGGSDLDIRMECWLPADTIRRMGFGRVIVHREPVLTIDRGASFVALSEAGAATQVEYGWAILAPQPRWIIAAKAQGSAPAPQGTPASGH